MAYPYQSTECVPSANSISLKTLTWNKWEPSHKENNEIGRGLVRGDRALAGMREGGYGTRRCPTELTVQSPPTCVQFQGAQACSPPVPTLPTFPSHCECVLHHPGASFSSPTGRGPPLFLAATAAQTPQDAGDTCQLSLLSHPRQSGLQRKRDFQFNSISLFLGWKGRKAAPSSWLEQPKRKY